MRVKLVRPQKENPCLQCHHVFNGPNRKHSEKYNAVIYLSYEDHLGDSGVHKNKAFRESLQAEYQKRMEDAGWTRAEFMQTFGMNFL